MKKKLLMLSMFALATSAMASATLKEEVNYDFKGTPTDVNVIKPDDSEDTTKQDHPLMGIHTPKAVTSLNIDTDLVKSDLSFLLKRDFTYTPTNVSKLDDNSKYRRVNNLTDGQTVSDLYGDAELTYKLNDNLTAKGFLHYNQNGIIKDKDIVKGAVKIGLDYDYAGVSGRGLLMALDPMLDSNIWHGFSMTAKTNLDKFELTGDAFGLFEFKNNINGKIIDEKSDSYDMKGIYLPKFYSEINLGAKYADGPLTSDNKLHYHSFIDLDSSLSTVNKSFTQKTYQFNLGGIEKFMKDHKDSDTLPELDLKYTTENTYKYNDNITFTGNGTLEHKINALKINIETNTNIKVPNRIKNFIIPYRKGVLKDADYIINLKPGVKYENQMDALKLTGTGDAEMSYDYNRKSDTTMTDKLSYKSYSDSHTAGIKPGVEIDAEYKVNDELKVNGNVGLKSDFEYKKENTYDIITDPTKAEYKEDSVTSTQAVKPSLGAGLEYMNGPLTASLKANISNVDTFTTIKKYNKAGELLDDYTFERKYELDNKGTNIHAKLDYKLNDQISFGSEASVNMSLSNDRTDLYDKKDGSLVEKGNETTVFKVTDNGQDGDKKSDTFFSIYGSYTPMNSLTTTATAKVALEATRRRLDSFKQKKDNFKLDKYQIQSAINKLTPSFELKADYTILEGLKLGAKTSIGADFGTYKYSDSDEDRGYIHLYDEKGNELDDLENKISSYNTKDKEEFEKGVKAFEKIGFEELRYNLGLTLSYEW